MAQRTMTLSATQEKGLEVYIAKLYPGRNEAAFLEKTVDDQKQETFEFLISSSLGSVLRSEFERQNHGKTLDQIAQEIV